MADGLVMSITAPQKWTRVSSTVTVKGTGSSFEGDVGTVFVLDHLSTDIGHARGVLIAGSQTVFTAQITYTASFHGGAQEGVLALYRLSMADSSIAGAVMQKILISA